MGVNYANSTAELPPNFIYCIRYVKVIFIESPSAQSAQQRTVSIERVGYKRLPMLSSSVSFFSSSRQLGTVSRCCSMFKSLLTPLPQTEGRWALQITGVPQPSLVASSHARLIGVSQPSLLSTLKFHHASTPVTIGWADTDSTAPPTMLNLQGPSAPSTIGWVDTGSTPATLANHWRCC